MKMMQSLLFCAEAQLMHLMHLKTVGLRDQLCNRRIRIAGDVALYRIRQSIDWRVFDSKWSEASIRGHN